jgi:ankyrin repeat protein
LVEALKNLEALHDLDVTERTALHYVCDSRSASLEKVNILLKHGASKDIEVCDHRMQTPLHLAAMLHSGETLARLLDSSSAAVNFIDCKGRTPLHYACMHWTTDSIQDMKIMTLIDHGAGMSIGIPDGPTGRTPIHIAVISGTPSRYLMCLLDAEPSAIHVCDDNGRTPLHYACHGRLGLQTLNLSERAERVLLLLQHGALPHTIIQDKRGQTPIEVAIKTGASHKILEILGVENRLEKHLLLSSYTDKLTAEPL